MESATMGKVLVKARIENVADALRAKSGQLPLDQVRALEVDDALVDTGSKLLALPSRMIQQLGLQQVSTKNALTSIGITSCKSYGAVWLTIEGRSGTVDVAEVSDECPVLVGYLPLELLDLVVDPVSPRVTHDPAHGGQQVLDLL